MSCIPPPDGSDPPIGHYMPAKVTSVMKVEGNHSAGAYYSCGYEK